MTNELILDQTEYLVVGETPDTSERLNVGDRYLLDTSLLELDRGTEGITVSTKAVLTEQTEAEADTVEGLIGKCLGEPDDGGVMEEDKALGEGQGVGGPRQGEGGADMCVCPSCGAETEHERGTPCAEVECPQCGQPMRGRKSLADWAGDLGDEAYKALLDHLAETERLTEEEAGLLAPDELEGLVGAWLETEEGQKVGRRLAGKWVTYLEDLKAEVDGFFASLAEKLGGLLAHAKYEDQQETMPDDWASLLGGSKSGFKVWTGADGKRRWVAWAASAFRDREGEIFKTKALAEYVERAWKEDDHGKLWFYHMPIALGDADFTALAGRILVKAGTWADTPIAKKAVRYFAGRRSKGWGASVGYKYRKEDRADGEYDWLWIFETSPVPDVKAAFPFSRFDSFGGNTKMLEFTPDQVAKAEEIFGKGWKETLGLVEDASKVLEESLDFKAILDLAEKAGANPVQMLKLALGKIKDEAAKGLVEKAIAALEKGGYQYPKPEKKADEECEEEKPKKKRTKAKEKDEEEEEYGKPKKADEEEEEEEEKPKKKKSVEELPPQIEIEGLGELVAAVKAIGETVTQQGAQITRLTEMMDTDDDERAREKIAKAPPVVAYKASIAGLLDDEEKGEKGAQPAVTGGSLLDRMAQGTPLGPQGG